MDVVWKYPRGLRNTLHLSRLLSHIPHPSLALTRIRICIFSIDRLTSTPSMIAIYLVSCNGYK